MHRLQLWMFALLLLAPSLATAAPNESAGAPESDRPNFLFIIVDDQSPMDLSVYNSHSQMETPAIQRLAERGVVFDQAYHMGAWTGAVCTASRRMLMTGRNLWHIPGSQKFHSEAGAADAETFVPIDLQQQSLPAVFNRAGYVTMRTCKRGNSYEPANKLFQIRKDATKRGGTHETGSGWHGDQVIDFLEQRQQAKDRPPFLIYYGFSHPHDRRDGTPELLEKYGASNHDDRSVLPILSDRMPPVPRNWLPAHPFHHGHPGLRDEVAVSGVWKNRDTATIRNETGRQYACSENIDYQIDRVLKHLEATGDLENTYVIYTADHGMAIGRHGLQGKQNLYEHTWRVPYIIAGPGIEPQRVTGNIYLHDTLATLCDYAGIRPPETNHGLSYRPVVEGKQALMRETLYGCYCGGTKPGIRSLRHGDWKLIEYDVLDGTLQQTQLFNLRENPLEFLDAHRVEPVEKEISAVPQPGQTNLAQDPRYAAKLAEMRHRLLKEMERYEDPYRLWYHSAEANRATIEEGNTNGE